MLAGQSLFTPKATPSMSDSSCARNTFPFTLVFSDERLPDTVRKSVFLAGPSPRRPDEPDWRHEALSVLAAQGFDGTVLVPIPAKRFYPQDTATTAQSWTYDGQVSWECAARAMADVIAFWVPRVIDRSKADLGMPAFTTNFELGEDLSSGKVVYGRPAEAVKCAYLDTRAQERGLTVHESLQGLVAEVTQRLGQGALRTGGEVQVPLHIWNSEMFRSWYQAQKAVGNRLDGASLMNSVVLGRGFLFGFLLRVNVWVQSEQRHKSNEFFYTRRDVSSVVAVYRDEQTRDVHVALVREFRSTVNNAEGFVVELPSGSAAKAGVDPRENAQHELSEECGLYIDDLSRFVSVSARQLMATVSTHRSHLYAVELTKDEFEHLKAKADSGQAFGVAQDSERTYVEVETLDSIFERAVDYSTLGMVMEAVQKLGLNR